MYVCLCKGITDSQIRAAASAGHRSVGHLRRELGLASQCGKCRCQARDLLRDCQREPTPASAVETPYYAVA